MESNITRRRAVGMSPLGIDRVETATNAVKSWLELNDFAGWDPFDLLNSPLLKPVGARNRLAGIAFVQLGKRSPINLRPALRVQPVRNAKAIGLALSAYVQLRDVTGQTGDESRIRDLAAWLVQNTTKGYAGACWGYPFDWPNRSFAAPSGTPSVVTTYFCASALLKFGLQRRNLPASVGLDFDPLKVARRSCDFVMTDLNRLPDAETPRYFSWSYTPLDRRQIHNASLLGARLLAEVGAATGDETLNQLALESAYYTATRQRPDGSWPYGEDRRNSWVDNFHTAYVVSSLLSISNLLHDKFLLEVALKGYAYWARTCFRGDGAPKWGPHRLYPIDIHSSAQAVITFVDFAAHDPDASAAASRVAKWTLENMQTAAGQFAYQKRRFYRVRIPYARWSQAWMFSALVALLGHLRVSNSEASSQPIGTRASGQFPSTI